MFDYETLKVIWWMLIGVLIIGFAIMDGFDLGIGVLLPFIGKSDEERRVLLNVIGPTWESNQVWFVSAAGALFAAWPMVYATAFSGFYVAFLMILFALFLRPVGFDYRSKVANKYWRSAWDWGLFAAGLIPGLVFGIAFGNVIQGVPFHFDSDLRSYYTGSFWDLLNPFALLCGLLCLAMMVMQGAMYLQKRTEDIITKRCRTTLYWAALTVLILFSIAGIWIHLGIEGYSIESSQEFNAVANPLRKTVQVSKGAWMKNYSHFEWLVLVPLSVYLMGFLTILFANLNRPGIGFLTSSVSIAGIILTAALSMFPFLLPSITHPNHSLTVWDASASQATLNTLFWAVVICLPIVIIYTNRIYRVLRGNVTVQTIRDNQHSAY